MNTRRIEINRQPFDFVDDYISHPTVLRLAGVKGGTAMSHHVVYRRLGNKRGDVLQPIKAVRVQDGMVITVTAL